MQVINGRQIEILLVPCEERLPTADVHVWCVDSFALVPDRILDQRLQVVHVPGSCFLVHQRVQDVSSVQWWREANILPKLNLLQQITFDSTSSEVSPSLILSKGQTFYLYSFIVIDFFWISIASYTPPFPNMFCSIGPFTSKLSINYLLCPLFGFQFFGGTTFTIPYLFRYCFYASVTNLKKSPNYF